jgi:hypothetical protein
MKKETLSKITYESIFDIFLNKGFAYNNILSNAKPYELTIVGIRSETPVMNKFEDLICFLYKDEFNKENIFTTNCTTIPGLWGLSITEAKENNFENELNPNGTAIVKEGRYSKVWKLGLHYGKEALVQIGKFDIYRQRNLDGQLHLDESSIISIDQSIDLMQNSVVAQYAGINCHRCRDDKTVQLVNNWSLACQAVNDPKAFIEIIRLAHQQVDKTKIETFDYILINEREF